MSHHKIAYVDFNYAAGRIPGPFTCALGLVLLLILAVTLPTYQNLRQQSLALQAQWQARQVATRPAPVAQATPVSQVLLTELALAQAQINTPWLALLHDLEQAQQEELYWMQLAPDTKRKQIRMTVLAHKHQQGWALVDRLRKNASFSAVKLNSSESTEVNGIRMTSLQLEATWKF